MVGSSAATRIVNSYLMGSNSPGCLVLSNQGSSGPIKAQAGEPAFNCLLRCFIRTFLQQVDQLFFQLADKLGVFSATNRGPIGSVVGPIPMGIAVDQIIVVNISEGLIGFTSFFDVAAEWGKTIWNCMVHGPVFSV